MQIHCDAGHSLHIASTKAMDDLGEMRNHEIITKANELRRDSNDKMREVPPDSLYAAENHE